MRFTKRIQDLPTNRNGERQLEPHHLDDNFAAQDDALLTTLAALFATGGVAVAGTVMLTGLNVRVQGRTGITLDGRVPLHVDDQTLDLTPLAAGKGLVVMITDPVTIQRPYADVVTGESLTDSMNVSAGRLSVISAGQQGVTLDGNGYPTAPSNTLPVAQVTRTAGGATLDSTPAPGLTIRAGVAAGVVSVNGKAGVVTLVPADIGAAAAADLASKADLVAGKILSSQLPSIAIGERFVVASQAAMLALTAQIDDIAARTDLANHRFLLTGNPATLADWIDLDAGSGGGSGVTSVNARTGSVVLGAADVGAIATAQAGAVNGIAQLGADGLLLSAQRPPSSGNPGNTGLARLSDIQPIAHIFVAKGTGVQEGPFSNAPTVTWNMTANSAINFSQLDFVVNFPGIAITVYGADGTTMLATGTTVATNNPSDYPCRAILSASVAILAGAKFFIYQNRSVCNSDVGRYTTTDGTVTTAPFFSRLPAFNFASGMVLSKQVQGPLDAVDVPVVNALANLPSGGVAIFDAGGATAPRWSMKRADGTVWYGAPFTNTP